VTTTDQPRLQVSSALTRTRGLNVLYIVYWGALEPLGQALVLPPVLRLAAAGVRLTLVTFEKPDHFDSLDKRESCARQLREGGVRWLPRRYHAGMAATALDVAQALAVGLAAVSEPHLVVGRTYVGGVMGLLVSKLLRRPFIFHNEGFWPDEMIEAGNWSDGCRRYRLAKRIEHGLYRQAAGVIALTKHARRLVTALRPTYPPESTVVVPSCVDLDTFRPAETTVRRGGPLSLAYSGSLGGRYRIEEMARFLRVTRQEVPSASLTIYSHSSAELIRSRLRGCGVPDDAWSLVFVPHQEMAGALRRHTAGLLFQATGISSQVGSPTKIGEYWACGLPVVTTPLVGDVEGAIHEESVGVIIPRDTDDACRAGARQLRDLLQDPDLGLRCRRAAERLYDLNQGVAVQLGLFQKIVAEHHARR
jgi:glycosyltransferase involved in cell wall biosynthesis